MLLHQQNDKTKKRETKKQLKYVGVQSPHTGNYEKHTL